MKILYSFLFTIASVLLSFISVYLISLDSRNTVISTLLIILPSIPIIIYSALAINSPKRNSKYEMVRHVGEEIYFIGYLCTISVVVSFVFIHGVFNLEIPDTPTILRALSIGLSTTLLGLFLMNLLKNWAFCKTESFTVSPAESSESSKIASYNTELINKTDFQEVTKSFSSLARELKGLNDLVIKMKASLDDVPNSIERATEPIKSIHQSAKEFVNVAKELQKLEFNPRLIKVLESSQKEAIKCRNSFNTLNKKLEETTKAISITEAESNKLGISMQNSARLSSEFSSGVNELHIVLDGFVELMKAYLNEKIKNS